MDQEFKMFEMMRDFRSYQEIWASKPFSSMLDVAIMDTKKYFSNFRKDQIIMPNRIVKAFPKCHGFVPSGSGPRKETSTTIIKVPGGQYFSMGE